MGGKSDAPAAPDYVGQANAQAAGNLTAARSQTQANRIDQFTPYGSIKYTQGDSFDQAGYDAALAEWKNAKKAFDDPSNAQMQAYRQAGGTMASMPDRAQFTSNPDHWSSSIELSDTGKKLLDAYNATSLGLADLQGSAMDRVRASLDQPMDLIDLNGETGMDGWSKASDLIRQRMNPDLDRQQSSLDTKLANQGLTQGSEGWGIQQQQFGKQRNDANIAAELAGSQVQNQMFGQALAANAAKLQQRQAPLQELNALRSGAQVTNPTFFQPGQQAQTSGPDLMGASQAGYNAAVGNVNANNAQTAQTNGALGSAALMAAAYFF